MKVENIVINVLVALVALLAGHIFWPGVPPTGKALDIAPSVGQAIQAPTIQSAPTVASTPTAAPAQPMPQFPPDLRARLDKARAAALAGNPGLKAEEDDLVKQRDAMMKKSPPATMQDRQDLMAKWTDHSKKMRAAMISADPSLQSFFDELDARIKQRQAQMSAGTNSAPVNPATVAH